MNLKPVNLEKIIADTSGLPVFNEVVDRIIEIMGSPNTTAKEIAEVIEADTELTEKLLTVINSPFFGFSRDISSVMQALVTLGFGMVKDLIVSMSVLNQLKIEGFPVDLKQFADDAFTSAVAAKLIVRHFNELQSEVDAFMMGLLMNVGQLVFALHFPEEYSRILEQADKDKDSLSDLERNNFFGDHAQAGSMLLKRWGFKDEVIQPIFHHHTTNPPDQVSNQMTIMISTAYIAHLILEVFRSKMKKESLDSCVREANRRLGFSEDTVHRLLQNMGRESEGIAKCFGFKTHLSTDYTELLKTLNIQLGELNLSYQQMVKELGKAKMEAERLAHQLKIANEELRNRADLDGLTGIFNHRYFQEHLAVEFMRAKRYKSPLALLLFDVDLFKKVNDNYGHVVGDVVLKQIALLLKINTRVSDIVARYGGEEFVLVLTETQLNQAYFVAEKIRNIIENHPIHYNTLNLHVTVSAGVSAMDEGKVFETAFDLINSADKKLYKAKKGGRNQVVK